MNRRSRNRKSLLAEEAHRQGIITSSASAQGLQSRLPGPSSAMTPLAGGSQIPRRLELSASVRVQSVGREPARPRQMMKLAGSSMIRSQSTDFLNNYTISAHSTGRTPRNRSQSPGGSLFSTSSRTTFGTVDTFGSCKFPDHKDTVAINKIAATICEILPMIGYQKAYTVKEIKDINAKQFNAVCLWLIQRLWEPYEGPNNHKDEIKFIQTCLGPGKLNFPGKFAVTHISTPNTASNRPYALTILLYLCCLLEDYEREDEEDQLDEQGKMERLHWQTLANIVGRQADGVQVDLEWEKQRFAEQLEMCLNPNDPLVNLDLDALEAELTEKQQELDKLNAMPDPREPKDPDSRGKLQEVLQSLAELKAKLVELENQKKDLEALIVKHRDIGALVREQDILKDELQRHKKRLDEVHERIQHQDINLEQAKQLEQETKSLQLEQISLKNISLELSKKRQQLLQFVENDEKQCYAQMAKLSVLDDYNNEAKKSNGVLPVLETNPSKLEDLARWIKDVEKNMKMIEMTVERHCKNVRESKSLAEENRAKLEDEVVGIRAEYDSVASERNQKRLISQQHKEELEGKLHQLKVQEASKREEMRELQDKHRELLQEINENKAVLEHDQAKLEEAEAVVKKWEDHVLLMEASYRSATTKMVHETGENIKRLRELMQKPFDVDFS